jgi:uncharacterized protein YcbX
LLQKTADWQHGYGVNPANRAQATLHIIGAESVEQLAAQAEIEADVRRFRAGIVLRGLGAHAELGLIGKSIRIGDGENPSTIDVDRGTPRCPVPSFDPETGKDLKDLSLRSMPKALNRKGKEVASAGVYAHQVNKYAKINAGDIVSVV